MSVIKINGKNIPAPDGELSIKAEKIKTENETEAGTMQVIVVRSRKLTVSADFTLTGTWVEAFRKYRDADSVKVSLFYPESDKMTDYTMQFEMDESLIKDSRKALDTKGLYTVSVTMTEF